MVRPLIGSGNTLSVSFRPGKLATGVRNELGQFMSIQSEIETAHRRMAEELQRQVVDQFDDRLDRPNAQRPTRYLEVALKSPEAIRYNVDGFLYLPDGYLESSPAKSYWRNLEKGTRIFVGREMQGFFRSLEGRPSPALNRRRGLDVWLIQVNAAFGGATRTEMRNGKPVTVETQHRQSKINRRLWGNHTIRIQNPIRAHRYLELGIEKYVSSGFQQREYDNAFAKFASYRKGVSPKGNIVALRD